MDERNRLYDDEDDTCCCCERSTPKVVGGGVDDFDWLQNCRRPAPASCTIIVEWGNFRIIILIINNSTKPTRGWRVRIHRVEAEKDFQW